MGSSDVPDVGRDGGGPKRYGQGPPEREPHSILEAGELLDNPPRIIFPTTESSMLSTGDRRYSLPPHPLPIWRIMYRNL